MTLTLAGMNSISVRIFSLPMDVRAVLQFNCKMRGQMEPRDNQGGKPVDGLPHVCMAASQIDMFRREFSD